MILSGKQARALEFKDAVPLAGGQILEIPGSTLFDQLGQIPMVLPEPLRRAWDLADRSALAAELQTALTSCVTAVAYRADTFGDQLVLISQSGRLADAFRAAYGVPDSMMSWRDPDSDWVYAVTGSCILIRE